MPRAKWMLPFIVTVLWLAACSPNKATVDNYKTLDWTMTRDQVYSVLGQPSDVSKQGTDSSDNTTIEMWNGKEQDLITITFVNNKLAMKSMRSNGTDY